MSLPVKLGSGLLGLSAVVIPGVWMVVTAEPGSKTVADIVEAGYTGKFGEDFKYHLVSEKENSKWWDWSFKYRWQADSKEERNEEFKDIKDGSSLRDKCKEVYAKESKTEDKKLAWRYCSLEGQKPVTVKDAEDKDSIGSGKIGKKHESDLVSIKDPRNNKFWEIQERAFFAEGGLGKNATDKSAFKALYDGKKGKLREKCREVYEKEESGAETDKKDAIMFCSLSPKSTQQ